MPGPGSRLRASGRDDRRGIAALEYALLAGLVGMGVLGAAVHFSGAESSLFGAINLAVSQLSASASGSSGSGSGGSTGGTSTNGTSTGGTSTGGGSTWGGHDYN